MAAALVDSAQRGGHAHDARLASSAASAAAADLLARASPSGSSSPGSTLSAASLSSSSCTDASECMSDDDEEKESCDGGCTCAVDDGSGAERSSSTALVATSSPAPPPSSSSSSTTASCAMTVLTAVERSVLRMLAFVFYQLDREQARFCASSILRGYFQLQTQLPDYAVESLERVAASVIALSDAKFTTFWFSLLEKELEMGGAAAVGAAASSAAVDGSGSISNPSGGASSELLALAAPEARITIQSYDPAELRQAREKTLVRRLYQHVYCGIRSLFAAPRRAGERGLATQTPCTSPAEPADECVFPRARRRQSRSARFDDDEPLGDASSPAAGGGDCGAGGGESRREDDEREREDARGWREPGWAVEYMEQESTVSSELTRRMRKMMHSSIPLNLFRVTVAFGAEARADAGADGFVGVISPESFPPTPVTRDLQTRRMNRYTARVLDHTTLALRLLEANSYSRTYQQLR